ncbi:MULTISPECIES: hypothetical protein [unclassified Caballeronia]|nr:MULTISPECIES: hypothetical protein [unclassified Caballeronia]MDR5801615.1 hypothetical protein [Caballeronia sp. LZ001]MDR5846664.1 hypothetical protein [Caballeronia sp. LZ003]
MKERPLAFSAPMVRAILDGRKTQTRRVVKLPHANSLGQWEPTTIGGRNGGCTKDGQAIPEQGAIWHTRTADTLMCPYGQPGDRLWVRETWQGPLFDSENWEAYLECPEDFKNPKYCHYAADGGSPPEFINMDDELVCRWQSSTCMPRWASRITLEITSVRVERVQEISDEDAIAEGIVPWRSDGSKRYMLGPGEGAGIFGRPGSWKPEETPQLAYAKLWDSENQQRGLGWTINPWVWSIRFELPSVTGSRAGSFRHAT